MKSKMPGHSTTCDRAEAGLESRRQEVYHEGAQTLPETTMELMRRAYATLGSIGDTDCVEFLDGVKRLKKLLEVAKASHEKMVEYAVLEAMTYVEIAESGLHGKFGTRDQNIISWLEGLSPDERRAVVDGAKNGTPIGVWYEEDGKIRRHKVMQSDALDYMDRRLEEFEKRGLVKISTDDCVAEMRGQASRNKQRIADAVVNRLRTNIMKHSGVCIGDGQYVNVGHDEFYRYAHSAVQIRVKSILGDVKSLCTIASNAKEPVRFTARMLRSECASEADGNDAVVEAVIEMLTKLGVLAEDDFSFVGSYGGRCNAKPQAEGQVSGLWAM